MVCVLKDVLQLNITCTFMFGGASQSVLFIL